MILEIGNYVKRSAFQTWTKFGESFGYKSRMSAKQKMERYINELNRLLSPLDLEVWFKSKTK